MKMSGNRQVPATVMNNSVGALVMSVANVTQQSASDVGHATLYGACAGLERELQRIDQALDKIHAAFRVCAPTQTPY
jgi:hypothetical protein